MLEIFVIIAVSQKIAAMMKEKNRGAAGFIVLFVILWLGGEIVGAIVGVLATELNDGPVNDGFPLVPYFFALIGAAIGGTIGYVIPASLSPLEDPARRRFDDFDDEDEYERERRRRKRDAEAFDDPAPPRRKRDDGTFEEDR